MTQFDVAEDRPNVVLSKLWSNLTAAEKSGDAHASFVRQNLRILVAGGDGTVTWVLGSIMDLALDPMPPVAVMPLGTGNDFSFNFGWGKSFQWKWVDSERFYRTLTWYRNADVRAMDAWRCELMAPDASYFGQLPHSLNVMHDGKDNTASGRFWNYFSIGLDAAAAYSFHSLRENHPQLAASRLTNQAWYGIFSCTTGWFCGSQPIAKRLKLRVRSKSDEAWREIPLPVSVRAVVLLNLQTYGGGRDIWGLSNTKSLERKGFMEPAYDDGMIDVVGFRSGWHTTCVMGQVNEHIHAKRLAQGTEVEFLVVEDGNRVQGDDDKSTTYLQLDGEPWAQDIPSIAGNAIRWEESEDGRAATPGLRVRVSWAGKSYVLCNSKDMLGGKTAAELKNRADRLRTTLHASSLQENGEV